MVRRCRTAIIATVLSCCVAGSALSAPAQEGQHSYPARLPYSFSNFAWWTDDELRMLLKKRIPGIGDDVETTTAAEGRIRDALTALLREKGIAAQVMSIEPILPGLRRPLPDLLGMDVDPDLPSATKPSIVFELVKPQVVIGAIKVKANADDALAAAKRELQRNEGKEFTEWSLHFLQYEVEKSVKRLGYFDAKADLNHGSPHKQGERYLVDEEVVIDAGSRYRFASITADGGPLLAGKDLSGFFVARAGEPAVPSPFGQLGLQLRAFYQQHGYADVHITSDPVLDREHATISYALRVMPGSVYDLRSLTINKLDAEQEKRVRKILGMMPGDVYREKAITDLYHAIPDEPLLKGYTFGFSPKPDRSAAVVDLTLDFAKKDGEATVTIQ